MGKTVIQFILMFIIMVLAQIIIFNHLCLFNVATPLLFIYFIIKLPFSLNQNWLITLSFFIGFIIDIFSDTYGTHALSCTIISVLKRPIFKLYTPNDETFSNIQPSIKTLGFSVYCKYVITFSLFYSFVLFIIESFTFFNPLLLIIKIISSAILTSILIVGIDSIISRQREKRL